MLSKVNYLSSEEFGGVDPKVSFNVGSKVMLSWN